MDFFFFSLHQVKNKGGEKSHPFDKTSVVCIYTAQVAVRIEENNIFFDYIVMSLNNDVTYCIVPDIRRLILSFFRRGAQVFQALHGKEGGVYLPGFGMSTLINICSSV